MKLLNLKQIALACAIPAAQAYNLAIVSSATSTPSRWVPGGRLSSNIFAVQGSSLTCDNVCDSGTIALDYDQIPTVADSLPIVDACGIGRLDLYDTGETGEGGRSHAKYDVYVSGGDGSVIGNCRRVSDTGVNGLGSDGVDCPGMCERLLFTGFFLISSIRVWNLQRMGVVPMRYR